MANNTGIAPSIVYTDRTFTPLLNRALTLLQNRITSFRYSALVATDVVPAILSVLAWFHEQNAFYYDRRRLNTLLFLADEPDSMGVLTLAQGYRMRPATSASVSITAFPSPAQAVPITLQKGARITINNLIFEIGADAVIPPGAVQWPNGSTSDLIVLVQGATQTETFVSDGSAFQTFTLGQVGTVEGSVVTTILNETWDEVQSLAFTESTGRGRDVFAGTGADNQAFKLSLLHAIIDPTDEDAPQILVRPPNGTTADIQVWTQVTALTGAPREFVMTQDVAGFTTVTFGLAANGAAPPNGSTVDMLYLIAGPQKRYQLTYDADFRGALRFGDGVYGVIPPAGATITVTYRVGGGVQGNIPAGAVNTSIPGVLPNGARVNVSVVNTEAGSGGNPPETVDHARFFAPKFAKSNERAVTKEDWTTLAATYFDQLYGAPSHAAAYLRQSTPELNTVEVAVWGRDQTGALALAGTPLKVGIKNFLDSKRTITTTCEIVDGVIVLLDVSVAVTLEVGALRQTVFANITTAIQDFMTSSEVMPGVDVSISKLYSAIQAVDGVEQAEITNVTAGISQTLALGLGDGNTVLYSGIFTLPEGTTIVPNSLVIATADGALQVVDNGNGAFAGSNDTSILPGNPGNVVDYTAGTFSMQFATAPLLATEITATCHVQVFSPQTEDLGASNGSVATLNSATEFYPIVRRTPRGVWSGDPHRVVDGNRIGTTAQFRGTLPTGLLPSTLTFVDTSGSPQTVTASGTTVLLQGITQVGTYSTVTGEFNFTFQNPVTLPVRAHWQTATVDIFAPADYLPLTPGRVFMWGGFDADGTQGGAAALYAYDDGEGNIAGDVVVGGTINYETGHVVFTWNTNPPPGPAGGAALFGQLVQIPDGIRTQFDFNVSATGFGTGPFVDISRNGSYKGEGRTRFQFSDLSRIGVTFADAWDNFNTGLNGLSLNPQGLNDIIYSTGLGKVDFKTAPPVGARNFAIQITNVTTLLYSGFVFFVKTPGGPGLDKGLFADQTGRFWGPPAAGPSNTFPTDRLDALRGVYIAGLAGSPIAAGRDMQLTYDSLTGVPPALDIPVAGNQVAAVGRIALTEKPSQTFANM